MAIKILTGAELAALRAQAGMSQQKVANALFVNVTLISCWETGSREIAPLWARDLRMLFDSVLAGNGIPDGLGRGGRTNRHIMRRTETQMVRALAFIDAFSTENGRPPTYQEVGTLFGGSITVARNVITHLVDTGYVSREPNKARTLRVTEKGKGVLPYVGK